VADEAGARRFRWLVLGDLIPSKSLGKGSNAQRRFAFHPDKRDCEAAMAGEASERLVFISHAGEDTWIARQIAREVQSRGARPFLDQADVDVGAEYEEEILLFLGQANERIVLFTPWSLERPYVRLGGGRGRMVEEDSYRRSALGDHPGRVSEPTQYPPVSEET